jgi:hypothetical protein
VVDDKVAPLGPVVVPPTFWVPGTVDVHTVLTLPEASVLSGPGGLQVTPGGGVKLTGLLARVPPEVSKSSKQASLHVSHQRS